MYDLDDRIFLVELFEIYEPLLTERQREIFRLYYYNDFSLAEVSEYLGIRRQTVYGVLKGIEKKLATFEGQMKLAYKMSMLSEVVEKVKELIESSDCKGSETFERLKREIEKLEGLL